MANSRSGRTTTTNGNDPTAPGVGRIHASRAVVCVECSAVYDHVLYRGGCPSCTETHFITIAVALRERPAKARLRRAARG